MTATSLAAARQSLRESRVPRITSIWAVPEYRAISAAMPVKSLDGLIKQRTLRKPFSSNAASTRDPMKPDAPVTSIWSSGPIMGSLSFIRSDRASEEAMILVVKGLFSEYCGHRKNQEPRHQMVLQLIPGLIAYGRTRRG